MAREGQLCTIFISSWDGVLDLRDELLGVGHPSKVWKSRSLECRVQRKHSVPHPHQVGGRSVGGSRTQDKELGKAQGGLQGCAVSGSALPLSRARLSPENHTGSLSVIMLISVLDQTLQVKPFFSSAAWINLWILRNWAGYLSNLHFMLITHIHRQSFAALPLCWSMEMQTVALLTVESLSMPFFKQIEKKWKINKNGDICSKEEIASLDTMYCVPIK